MWYCLTRLKSISREVVVRLWTTLIFVWHRHVKPRLITQKSTLLLVFPVISLVVSIIILSPLLLPPGLPFYGDETYYIPWTLATVARYNLQIWTSGIGPSADILSLIPTLTLVGLSGILGQDLGVKGYLVLMAWISAMVPYVATKQLLSHWRLIDNRAHLELASGTSGLVCLLFFNNQAVIAGSNSFVWDYAMFPLLVSSLILFMDTRRPRHLIVFGLSTVLASPQPFWPFLVGVVGLMYFIVLLIQSPRIPTLVRLLKNSLWLVAIGLALNAFWIIPIFAGYFWQAGSTFQIYTTQGLINPSDLIFLSFWSLTDIFLMGESAHYFFWNHPQNYGLFSFGIPLLALVSLFAYYRNRKTVFIGAVLIVGAFLTAGTNEPLGFVYYAATSNLPYGIGGILRNPTKFVSIVTFSYALLLGLAPIAIISRVPLNRLPVRLLWKRLIRYATILGLVLLILTPIAYGTLLDLQGYTWPRYSPTSIPQQYGDLNNWLTANPGNYKVMWVPSGGAYDWKQNVITAFPDLLSSKPAVPFATVYPGMLSSTNNTGRALAFMGVKYVIYHGDSINYPNDQILRALFRQTDLRMVESINSTVSTIDDSLEALPIGAPGFQFGDSPFQLQNVTLQRQSNNNLTMSYSIPESVVSQGFSGKFEDWFGILIHGFPAGSVDFTNRIFSATVSRQQQVSNTTGFASFLVDTPLGNYPRTSIDLYANYYDSEYRQLTPLYFISRLVLVPNQITNRYVILENRAFAGAVFPQNLNVMSNSNITDLLKSNTSIVSFPFAEVTSFEQTSEVELRVSTKSSVPFVLVLTEPYDRLWRAYIGSDVVKPIPIYGLANGFLVNETGTVSIRIYYTLQDYLYFGIVLSVASFSVALSAIILAWRKTRRKILTSPKTIEPVPIPAQPFDKL